MKSIGRFLAVVSVFAAGSLYAADAAANWKNQCSKCHGPDGRGDTRAGHKLFIGDLTDAKLQAKFTDEEAFHAVKFGLKDAKGKVIMKPARGLTDDEIHALIAYLRTLPKT